MATTSICHLGTNCLGYLTSSYLTYKDILNCLKVSKVWKEIWDTSTIWTLLLKRDYPSFPSSLAKLQYKQCLGLDVARSARSFDHIATLSGHTDSISALHTAENLLFTGSFDCKIGVWSLSSLSKLALLAGHTDGINDLKTTGSYLFSASYDKTIRVWNLATLKCMQVLAHNASVTCIACYPMTLISSSQDSTIKIWKLEKEVWHLKTSIDCKAISCLQLRDEVLISGSFSGTFTIWDGIKEKTPSKTHFHPLLNSIPFCLEKVGDLVYIGLSNPSQYSLVSYSLSRGSTKIFAPLGSLVSAIQIVGNTLFCSTREGVKILDKKSQRVIQSLPGFCLRVDGFGGKLILSTGRQILIYKPYLYKI